MYEAEIELDGEMEIFLFTKPVRMKMFSILKNLGI